MESTAPTQKVVVLDDHAVIAAGIAQLIDAEPDFQVQGIYADLQALEEHIQQTPPDVLIMDLQLGDESVSTEIRELCYRNPALKILVFTLLDSKSYVHEAVAYGALGFLSKSSRQAELLDALRALAAGNHFFGAELGTSIANIDDTEIPVKVLSDRELDVLRRLALGFSPKEIGFELGLSDKTIHAHKNSIRQKLGLRRQSDLIRAAFSAGIVNIHDLVG
jgi:DNA-binding NarL/FixJ family response regulator